MKILAWPGLFNRWSNPYTYLLYEAMQRRGVEVLEYRGWRSTLTKVDIFHLHWPEGPFNGPSRKEALRGGLRCLLAVTLARARGARVVWTVHNLQSHEHSHPRLERLFWRLLVGKLDGVISLSESGLAQVRARRLGSRKIPSVTVAHGHYRDSYPNQTSREQARRRLKIGGGTFVVGWIGQLRPYKGLSELLDAWRRRPAGDRALLIAGHVSDATLGEAVAARTREDASIRFFPGRVTDDDLQYYLNAANVLVMPYRKILNSGSALLGLSFNRPVALPRTDVMTELQQQVGADWVYLYDGKFNERILRDICDWAAGDSRPAEAPLAALDWDALAKKTLDFYRDIT